MDFTERMLKRNRAREAKNEAKESVNQTSYPLKEVHHNTVTTIASTSVDIKKNCLGSNKVTIETTVTMRKLPKRTSKSHEEDVAKEEETSCTEGESESTEEKENETSQDTSRPLRQGTKSQLDRLGVLYSDDPTRLTSPIHRTEDKFLSEEEEAPLQRSAKSTARSARLAALADTINHWEDDIRHHPVGERSGLKSPSKSSSVLTKHMVFSNKKPNEEHRRFISPQRATPREATTKVRQTSSEDPLPSILKRPMVKRTSPQTKHTTKVTKSIIWDKTVIDALVRPCLYCSG